MKERYLIMFNKRLQKKFMISFTVNIVASTIVAVVGTIMIAKMTSK